MELHIRSGRVGYAFNNWLVYGKVGGAWAHASGTASTGINGVQFGSISVDETVSGWMLGIGAKCLCGTTGLPKSNIT